MTQTSPPRRNLRDISSLFVSPQASGGGVQQVRVAGRSPHVSPSAPAAASLPVLSVATTDPARLSPTLLYGLGRWLRIAFREVVLLAPESTRRPWTDLARDYLPPESLPDPRRGGTLQLEKNLSLIFGEDAVVNGSAASAAQAVASHFGDENNPDDSSSGVWTCSKDNPPPERLVVRVLDRDLRRTVADPTPDPAAELWLFVLAPKVDEFIDCYRFLKARIAFDAQDASSLERYFILLDGRTQEKDTRAVQDAWLSITDHYLGLRAPILGAFELDRLHDTALPLARRIRQCEEFLGPPWPSDLQLTCGELLAGTIKSGAVELPVRDATSASTSNRAQAHA